MSKQRRASDQPHLRAAQAVAARLERELERQGDAREQRRRFYDSSAVVEAYRIARRPK